MRAAKGRHLDESGAYWRVFYAYTVLSGGEGETLPFGIRIHHHHRDYYLKPPVDALIVRVISLRRAGEGRVDLANGEYQ